MLSPEELEEAGEAVARAYRALEARMLAHLAHQMAAGADMTGRTATDVLLLAQSQAPALRRILEESADQVSAEVAAAVEDALRRSDEDDRERAGGAPRWPRQMESTARGVAEIVARGNVEMERGALDAYHRAVTEAVTRANSGLYDWAAASREAVRSMASRGVETVQYVDSATGRKTVRNRVDVAMARHVRTQAAQDAARMTEGRMREQGVRLVEVSSHEGARPEHAAWQGRVYGLDGPCEVEGVRYRGLAEATGYGTVSGLLGANCRHSFGPWRPGVPRAYSPDPSHPSGLPSSEVYELTQRQRAQERAIREAKREVSAMAAVADVDPSLASRAALLRAQQKLGRRQAKMRALIAEANGRGNGRPVLVRRPEREWAGDGPRPAKVAASGRTLDRLISEAAPEIARKGLAKAAVRRAVLEELAAQGAGTRDFAALGASEQRAMLRRALARLSAAKAAAPAKAKGPRGIDRSAPMYRGLDPRHVDAIAGIVDRASGPEKDLYLAMEGSLALADAHTGKRAYFSPRGGVFLDIDQVASEPSAPMETWFHEFGHHIDYASKVSGGYTSARHAMGAFGTELRAEVDGHVDAEHARAKAEAKALLDALDADGLLEAGIVSQRTHDAVRADLESLRELRERGAKALGYDRQRAAEVKALGKSAVAQVKSDARYKRHISKAAAYRNISKALYSMPDAEARDLSDIFEGATKARARGRWGHGASYWNNPDNLPVEAFAEMFSARMANEASARVLRRWLPRSSAVFDGIISTMLSKLYKEGS